MFVCVGSGSSGRGSPGSEKETTEVSRWGDSLELMGGRGRSGWSGWMDLAYGSNPCIFNCVSDRDSRPLIMITRKGSEVAKQWLRTRCRALLISWPLKGRSNLQPALQQSCYPGLDSDSDSDTESASLAGISTK